MNERGNVLFIILVAVALFAALSYAITNDRTTAKDSSGEEQKLDQAVVDNYMTCINHGQMTLNIARGCTTINYDPPSEWSGSNFKCHMFHPQGGGCSYQDLGLDSCAAQGGDLTELEIGEECGGIVYAGESGGNRIYTTTSDQGSLPWNNGTTNYTVTGATSISDGLANTNTLLNDPVASDAGAPYTAAAACRVLGADWYLPARDELNLLYTNKDEGVLNGTFVGRYWSSTEQSSASVRRQKFSDGSWAFDTKFNSQVVRCVRRD